MTYAEAEREAIQAQKRLDRLSDTLPRRWGWLPDRLWDRYIQPRLTNAYLAYTWHWRNLEMAQGTDTQAQFAA